MMIEKPVKLCECGNPAVINSKYSRCFECGVKKRYADKVEAQRIRREIAKGQRAPHVPKSCACGCGKETRYGIQYRFATNNCKRRFARKQKSAEEALSKPIPTTAADKKAAKARYMPNAYTGSRVEPPLVVITPPEVRVRRFDSFGRECLEYPGLRSGL